MHTYSRDREWNFRSQTNPAYAPTMWLGLDYEIELSSISDDYSVDEASATDLWRTWLRRLDLAKRAEAWGLPFGHVPIWWFVSGDALFEGAPFVRDDREDFLTHYTWPVDPQSGEHLQFSRLEVNDRGWNSGTADKGGFIQEATGWKPAALQPSVDIARLARAARLPLP